jgi:hypothetical protein
MLTIPQMVAHILYTSTATTFKLLPELQEFTHVISTRTITSLLMVLSTPSLTPLLLAIPTALVVFLLFQCVVIPGWPLHKGILSFDSVQTTLEHGSFIAIWSGIWKL